MRGKPKGKSGQTPGSAQNRGRGRRGAQRRGLLRRTLLLGVGGILCAALAAAAVYAFGSFELRRGMERAAVRALDTVRHRAFLPGWARAPLNAAYDAIPGVPGTVVEGAGFARSDGPALAGVPASPAPVRLLRHGPAANLFDPKERQTRCVLLRLDQPSAPPAPEDLTYRMEDGFGFPREAALRFGDWTPRPLLPIRHNGGVPAAYWVPMEKGFYASVWQPLLKRLMVEYPERFGTVWLQMGPVYRETSSKFANGIPIPDGFFAVAYESPASGGYRAIGFLVPQHARRFAPAGFLASPARIEAATGLTLLPDARPADLDGLRHAPSRLW